LSQKCADTAEDADNEDETEQERDISDKCKSIKLDSEKLDNNIELPWDVTRICIGSCKSNLPYDHDHDVPSLPPPQYLKCTVYIYIHLPYSKWYLDVIWLNQK
jgi:hypothetical protein